MEKGPEFCILCGAKDRKSLIERDSWHVYRCSSCGLGFLDPRPSKQDISKLYSKEYCEDQFVEGGEVGSPEFKKRLSLETHRVRFFRGLKRKGKILDIGCGYGYFLEACRTMYGYDVHGLDVSGWAAHYAAEKLGLSVTVGEIDTVNLPPNSYDVITMWHFLEHTRDPREAILKAMDLLKKDGILVIEVPNYDGTDARKNWDNWVGWQPPYHFYHFTPQTLKQLLGTCGFLVVKSKDYHSETVKEALKRIPVVSIFARLIAKMYSGHSIVVIAKLDDHILTR
jgi:2-polyprenyl-3-methyl-5-hydroxy-6-metoxy-1,4-benzoquinol methylase